jgi:hypothetical protein
MMLRPCNSAYTHNKENKAEITQPTLQLISILRDLLLLLLLLLRELVITD